MIPLVISLGAQNLEDSVASTDAVRGEVGVSDRLHGYPKVWNMGHPALVLWMNRRPDRLELFA